MSRTRRPDPGPPWTVSFPLPPTPRDERIQLVPLGPDVVELDYAAIMSSRQRLRRELQWNGWPPEDFTLDDNHQDLHEHQAEFERHEAFAYSVLGRTGADCLGCVYLEPWSPGAQLAFWVVDAMLDTGLEAHLLRTMATWLGASWPLARVIVPLRPVNERGLALAVSLGLAEVDGPDDHVSFELVARRLPDETV